MIDDVFVYLTALPDGITEMVTPCEDGYTVYIDANQSRKGMEKSYSHALKHIRENDHGKDDVQEIETEVRR